MQNNYWTWITDLPDEYHSLANEELPSLASVWAEQANSLKESAATKEFNERLRREWAIETGILEKLYQIDRGITQLLIEQGLDSSLIPHGSTDKDPREVMNIVKDHHDAIDGLYDFVSNSRDLTTSFVRELHSCITKHQPKVTAIDQLGNEVLVDLLRGTWKEQSNNPTRPDGELHFYCPPEHVQSEMDSLLSRHTEHIKKQIPPEIAAAWLHHKFTQIHPFQDGNGRVARALASLVFLRAKWFPLVVKRDDREKYIRALEFADEGDLKPLIELFSKLQKKAFVNALGLSRDVLKDTVGIADIIDSAHDVVLERHRQHKEDLQKVHEYSEILEIYALDRFAEIENMINSKFQQMHRTLNVYVNSEKNHNFKSHYFHYQIVEVAKEFDYFANTQHYRSWIRMCINTDTETNIFLSFHALGYKFNGVMACIGMTFGRDPESDQYERSVVPLGSEPFQFNYRDHEEALKVRFSRWFDEVIKEGLDRWRVSL